MWLKAETLTDYILFTYYLRWIYNSWSFLLKKYFINVKDISSIQSCNFISESCKSYKLIKVNQSVWIETGRQVTSNYELWRSECDFKLGFQKWDWGRLFHIKIINVLVSHFKLNFLLKIKATINTKLYYNLLHSIHWMYEQIRIHM